MLKVMIPTNATSEQAAIPESWQHLKIDLHTHSWCSDGALSPTELVSVAQEQDVKMLALTDHDSLDGLAEARQACHEAGIQFVNGMELSTQWKGIPLHVVVLGFDEGQPEVHQAVEHNQQIRKERAYRIALRLKRQGLPDIFDDVCKEAGDSQIGRPHFARVMVQRQLVKDEEAAFRQYLGNNKLGQIREVWPDMTDCLPKLSGCQLILAHPSRYKLTSSKLKRLLADFKACGGNGIEVSSGNDNPQLVRFHETLSRDLGLKASVGSDFHGHFGPWTNVGKFTPVDERQIDPVWYEWLS